MFSLNVRKIVVIVAIGTLFLLANVWLVASWLSNHGVIEWAGNFCGEFLTGTAITIVVVLLILIEQPRFATGKIVTRCSVCEHMTSGKNNYCPDCGSKLR